MNGLVVTTPQMKTTKREHFTAEELKELKKIISIKLDVSKKVASVALGDYKKDLEKQAILLGSIHEKLLLL